MSANKVQVLLLCALEQRYGLDVLKTSWFIDGVKEMDGTM
jgi:hypothetical protein